MVNRSAHDADTMVDDEPTVLHEQGKEMREYSPRTQHQAPAQWPHTPEPSPRPRSPETHTLSGRQFLGLVMLQKPRPAPPTLREAETAGNTSDVDVEQLGESAGGVSLPDVSRPDLPLPDDPLPNDPLPDDPLPDDHLPDVPLPEARPEGSVGEE
jgi:hypothetical protein